MPKKSIRYLLFGLLYFSQGSIMAYFTSLNALYMNEFGLTMTQIGAIGAIAMIPFILKIFLGMLSDKFNPLHMGHRKPYIIIGLVLQSLACIIFPGIHPGNQFALVMVCAFFMMTAMALYDTCTDGLALDTTPVEEEGTIQGFMVGGRAMGMVIVSGIIGMLAQNVS